MLCDGWMQCFWGRWHGDRGPYNARPWARRAITSGIGSTHANGWGMGVARLLWFFPPGSLQLPRVRQGARLGEKYCSSTVVESSPREGKEGEGVVWLLAWELQWLASGAKPDGWCRPSAVGIGTSWSEKQRQWLRRLRDGLYVLSHSHYTWGNDHPTSGGEDSSPYPQGFPFGWLILTGTLVRNTHSARAKYDILFFPSARDMWKLQRLLSSEISSNLMSTAAHAWCVGASKSFKISIACCYKSPTAGSSYSIATAPRLRKSKAETWMLDDSTEYRSSMQKSHWVRRMTLMPFLSPIPLYPHGTFIPAFAAVRHNKSNSALPRNVHSVTLKWLEVWLNCAEINEGKS